MVIQEEASPEYAYLFWSNCIRDAIVDNSHLPIRSIASEAGTIPFPTALSVSPPEVQWKTFLSRLPSRSKSILLRPLQLRFHG